MYVPRQCDADIKKKARAARPNELSGLTASKSSTIKSDGKYTDASKAESCVQKYNVEGTSTGR